MMKVFEKDKVVSIVMNDKDIIKIMASADNGDIIVIECKNGELKISKSNEDNNIGMAIALSKELMNNN